MRVNNLPRVVTWQLGIEPFDRESDDLTTKQPGYDMQTRVKQAYILAHQHQGVAADVTMYDK